jgi:hypothetical protein
VYIVATVLFVFIIVQKISPRIKKEKNSHPSMLKQSFRFFAFLFFKFREIKFGKVTLIRSEKIFKLSLTRKKRNCFNQIV